MLENVRQANLVVVVDLRYERCIPLPHLCLGIIRRSRADAGQMSIRGHETGSVLRRSHVRVGHTQPSGDVGRMSYTVAAAQSNLLQDLVNPELGYRQDMINMHRPSAETGRDDPYGYF